MNYGRYFRLNRNLSRIEDGFAIYDYIDLPAYFIASKDNLMSPKYPISMMVTSDSVVFRLHYCAYKIEEDVNIGKKSPNYPQYLYESCNRLDNSNKKTGDTTKIAHMEEVILELPFVDTEGRMLSDVIRSIYITNFPQIFSHHDNTDVTSERSNSSGGRFLERIIRKRYLEENKDVPENKEKDVNDDYYDSLRKLSDGATSYSTLWLMGLVTEEKGERRYRRTDKDGKIVGFLRKLLLDFMFDLKHSDVFQNSENYQKMYSGLMSDFYFSALMHKCEYYYCRKLLLEEITHLESAKKISERKQKAAKEAQDTADKAKDNGDNDSEEKQKAADKAKKVAKDAKETKEIKENCIKVLYANNLFKAEQVWVNDIMSPQAEKEFDFLHPKPDEPETHANNEKKSFISKIKAFFKVNNLIRDQFRRWDSWFAPPEEEMIRACFGMEEENSFKIHICNTDTLASYLNIDNDNINKNDDDKLDKELGAIRSEIRESISRWFLRRNDFHDTARLHLSKYSNWALVGFLLVLVILLYIIPIVVTSDYFESVPLKSLQHYVPMCVMLILIAAGYGVFSYLWSKKDSENNDNPLYKESRSLSKRRVTILFVGFALSSIVINSSWMTIAIIFLLIIECFLKKNKQNRMRFYFNKLISCLHLFFPRLVASITTAWLTITLGFDLYSSFFDKPISWPTAFFVSIVILMFIMFEINQITPRVNLRRKILRSLELLLISWCISILVGVVVIDFVGERYIERGGYIENFFAEYVVDENGVDKLSSPTNTDNRLRTNMVDDLTDYKPIAVKFVLGEHDVFYMRDFLFMFSFITMFMGIFLQMFIFDDKKMTEF